MSPRVTVIVLTYCNEAEAADCIESLLRSRYPELTILLVDNASPDGSGERLRDRFPQIEYLQTGFNGGYTAGNNRGIEWALARGADFLLILNDDTVVDPDCIPRLVETARETRAAVVAPQIVYHDEPEVVWYGGGTLSRVRAMGTHLRENEPRDHQSRQVEVSFVCGCCFLIQAGVVRSVGGFDETFFTYVEDTELSVRLAATGHRMVYDSAAIVLHRIGRSAPATEFQIRQRDRNRRKLVARHYGLLDRARFAAWFYPTRGVHLARYVARGEWSKAKAIVDGAFRRVGA